MLNAVITISSNGANIYRRHVLLIPKRVCARVADLSTDEVADLFAAVHQVGPVLEQRYSCSALNIAIQVTITDETLSKLIHKSSTIRTGQTRDSQYRTFMYIYFHVKKVISREMMRFTRN